MVKINDGGGNDDNDDDDDDDDDFQNNNDGKDHNIDDTDDDNDHHHHLRQPDAQFGDARQDSGAVSGNGKGADEPALRARAKISI